MFGVEGREVCTRGGEVWGDPCKGRVACPLQGVTEAG